MTELYRSSGKIDFMKQLLTKIFLLNEQVIITIDFPNVSEQTYASEEPQYKQKLRPPVLVIVIVVEAFGFTLTKSAT